MYIGRYTDSAYAEAIKTLLWSESYETDDRDDMPFDESYSPEDVVDERNEFLNQVWDFVVSNWDDVKDLDPGDVGHNFVLSRNRHGAGFWDLGLGELGDRLHEACDPYGNVGLLLGADERVYVHA